MRGDILIEFLEVSTPGQPEWSGLTVRKPYGREPPDAADKFLNASEEEREYIRQTTPLPISVYIPEVKIEYRYGIITILDANYIRKAVASGISRREMARRYHVAPITIQRIINGKTYKVGRKWASPHERRAARASQRRDNPDG